MKITIGQLRRLIRESLPYRKGQPWSDPQAPVGDPIDRAEDHLDRELTDKEVEAAMGWERADPAGDADFWDGYGDAANGRGPRPEASPDYAAGFEDGKRDRVTESRRKIKESANKLRKWAEGVGLQVDIDPMTGEEVVLISDTFAMKHGLPDGTDWGVERSVDDDGWIVTSSPDYGMMDFEMPSGDLSDLDDIGIGTRGY